MPALTRTSCALLSVTLLSGCQSTYLGRYASLRSIDVEDFRRLPSRGIAGAAVPSALPEAIDRSWVQRVAVVQGDRRVTDDATLDSLLAANGTTAFVILHRGRLIDERYYGGKSRDSMFKSFSISKSVLSALIGIAVAEGHLRTADSIGRYIDLPDNPALAAVSLQQLLDNVSGFEFRRGNAPWKDQPRMYYSANVRRYLTRTHVERPAGTTFAAEELSPLLAGYMLERALIRAHADSTISHYAQSRLWQPMGAQFDALWNTDRDRDGLEKTESGFVARAVDFARFGQLYLDGGMVGGRTVVPADWVRRSTNAPATGAPNRFAEGFMTHLWWGATRAGRTVSDFYANGHFGQRIYVSPDKQLVIVRMGHSGGAVNWTTLLGGIADRW